MVGGDKKMISPMDTEIDEPTEARVLSSFFFILTRLKAEC